MPTTLDQILAKTRAGLPALHARREAIEREAAEAPPSPPFLSMWDRSRVALIAEVKRRSPSAGPIRPDLDPAEHAAAYARAGASGISVLTEGQFFGGSLNDLRSVSRRVPVPTLRKDFILDELQILEARAAGASALLLIVRALTPGRLAELAAVAARQGLVALVEAHDSAEVAVALDSGAPMIGVNARNLDTFEIDVAAAWRLLGKVAAGYVAVAESGMASAEDVCRAAEAGADAVLIGTALSAAADPELLARACATVPRRGR